MSINFSSGFGSPQVAGVAILEQLVVSRYKMIQNLNIMVKEDLTSQSWKNMLAQKPMQKKVNNSMK